MVGAMDTFVLQALHAWRSDPLVGLFLFFSVIGETAIMLVATIAVSALFAFWYKQRAIAVGLVATMATSTAITYILKHVVARARPDIAYQAIAETGYSFPSGHSSAAAAFFGFLVYVVWTRMPPGPRRTLLAAAAITYVIVMAFGRLYVGAHYPSDVLIGLLIGALAAAAGSLVANRLTNRAASTEAPSVR